MGLPGAVYLGGLSQAWSLQVSYLNHYLILIILPVLFSIFSKKTSWQSIFAGMIVGTITLIIWKESGLGATLYEIVPGFMINVIVIMVVNKIYQQQDQGILSEFEEVEKIYQRDIK
ncbi:hypothetical protein DFR79_13023 [Halanaerobium saccharolyticum]|uniref:Sodium:solute symporter family protein n=1 Tax=Halanaerobium saccharolyticum TaxID=43595 RepID=A0A4R6LFK0_9FIRM|nr:hypothetical protein [Halanaerobium saccharolyticum]TDO78281.1 hypothetical protein DFR79_13023 [Halanaerobium saccharolyticum]